MQVPIAVYIVIALALICGTMEIVAKWLVPDTDKDDAKKLKAAALEYEQKSGQPAEKKASEIIGYAKKKL